METNALIEELKTIAQNEDALAVSREVNELKARFDDFMLEEERKEQVAALDAEVKGEEYEPKDLKPIKNAFYELYNIYRERRKEQAEAKNALESQNLKQKKDLLTRLKEVIEKEENIGVAYNAYKEIHETWKNVGDIAREKRDEIQKEYSKLLEDFFYNMKIYRELKDHDLKRNLQLKQAVVDQLESLKNNASLKEVEAALKALQNEWEEIGPVVNEEWENLKAKYWEHVRNLYERINAFYDERRTSLQENIIKKRELLTEAATLLAETSTLNTTKSWDEATEKLLNIQDRWKGVGFGQRKENEEVWQEFRKMCDDFFAQKKVFFGTIQEQYSKTAESKRKLIAEAISLKDSTDWKITADKLVQLQKQWKNTGNAGQKLEQKLWSDFRGACDSFFNARQKYFEEQDKELDGNLTKKKEIIRQIEAYSLGADKKLALNDLKDFTMSFNAAGKVPMKEKDTIYLGYKTAIDKHYAQLKLEGAEKDKIMFQARLDTLSGSPDASRAYAREKAEIRQQIEALKSDILQYENNLGFFARSKGADALRKDVEIKINASKVKIEGLIKKLKMIPNE
jgi:hypothetical protein